GALIKEFKWLDRTLTVKIAQVSAHIGTHLYRRLGLAGKAIGPFFAFQDGDVPDSEYIFTADDAAMIIHYIMRLFSPFIRHTLQYVARNTRGPDHTIAFEFLPRPQMQGRPIIFIDKAGGLDDHAQPFKISFSLYAGLGRHGSQHPVITLHQVNVHFGK